MVLLSSYRDEQSLRHGSKFLDLNQPGKKKRKKLTCKTFLCTITLRKIKMVAHTFHLSLVNANHFKNNNCRDSENFATMVT